MQHTTGVAVVAAQLAHTDRRALSQAWYSALHLAHHPPATRPAPAVAAPLAGAPNVSRPARGPNGAPKREPNERARNARGAARDASSRNDGGAVIERRTAKTLLARRIEHELTRHAPRGAPASFAVHGAGGRVHVIVRSDGAHTRVVAVCAPSLRERVERALAQARFALAGCGVRAEAA
jgi:hypothetical protein